MTAIRMSVATVTSSLVTKVSLCAVIVYNHRYDGINGVIPALLNRLQERSRGGRWSWVLIAGWIVLLLSCSSTVAFRTTSL